MCGIFGSVDFGAIQSQSLNALFHRGPDDFGEMFDEAEQVYLAHRRLSIIDLSRAGRQPMALNDSLYISYNGEVYNFQAIRRDYFSHKLFNSETDTEVILHLYRRFRYRAPEYLRGMFAFALYDKSKKELFLCRDRFGIKPLYYYQKDGKFAFASELSALKLIPGIDLEIDPIGLDYYFTYGYIPAPFSAYKFIRKLPPAHLLVYNISNRDIREIKPYWRLRDSIQSQPYNTEQDWIDAIEEKIAEAIKLRLMSDVPLGVFLSGGLDSSLVVSLMADMLEQPVKTFTIGFEDEEYDERSYAESVARRYRTEHHVEVVKPDAIEILPQLIKAFGEPFYDKSAIPTYYLSKMARKHVTVVLSGDGGDEVFAGYTRYSRMHRYAYLSGIPIIIRKIIQHLGMYLPKHLPGYGFLQRLGYDKFRLYQEMHSCFPVYEQEQLYSEYFKNILRKEEKNFYQRIIEEQDGFEKSFITQLQLIDLHSYLPEDILTKVDRMSMLHSLETRVPLLDHELIELVYACPPSLLFKNRTLKYTIKTILQDKVPSEIVQHKKQGFGVPLPRWFRNELKNLTESLIDKSKNDPFINNNFVYHLFHLHQKGGRNFSRHLYAILFYLYWRSAEERG